MCNYRPQTKFAGRMFLHASVILFTGGGGAWQGGMHGTRAPLTRTPPAMHGLPLTCTPSYMYTLLTCTPPTTHAPCHTRPTPATHTPFHMGGMHPSGMHPCCVLNYTTNCVSLPPDNSVKYPKLFKSM